MAAEAVRRGPLGFLLFLLGAGIAAFGAGFGLFYFVVLPIGVGRSPNLEVPDVTGRSLAQVQAILKEKDISYQVKEQRYDAVWPEGFVVTQDPPAKGFLRPNQVIGLVVSKGAEKVTVPSLAGLPAAQARTLLEKSGLRAVPRGTIYSDSIPKDCIQAQDPLPTTVVEQGSAVSLVVSLGPKEPKQTMPDLSGKTFEEAKELLASQGLILGEVVKIPSDSLGAGLVLMQAPQPGFQVASGDTVKLGVTEKR
jgi:eukaryotic-like serine/threonine-protein kinase